MEKRISYQQFQSVKAVAKAIDPIMRKVNPVKEKIEALVQEYKAYMTQVDALQAGIVQIIGFPVTDLVKKVIEPTGATDPKTGKPIKTTKYVPTDIVSYDEQHKQYIITVPDNDGSAEPEESVQPEAQPQAAEEEQAEEAPASPFE